MATSDENVHLAGLGEELRHLRRRFRAIARSVLVGLLVLGSWAPASRAETVVVDRALVRFSAPELGGTRSPEFVFARELHFEARLAALRDRGYAGGAEGFLPMHLEQALEQHIGEVLLSRLPISPAPSAAEIEAQTRAAREQLISELEGGAVTLEAARARSGLSERRLAALFRRKALASLYLDRMVTPMLRPSRALLYRLHQEGKTPFSEVEFETAEPALRNFYVRRELSQALSAFYQAARPRLTVELLE